MAAASHPVGALNARRAQVIADLERFGLDDEPYIRAGWRDELPVGDLEALLAAREDDDFDLLDETLRGSYAGLSLRGGA